jgi:hypothetical protein
LGKKKKKNAIQINITSVPLKHELPIIGTSKNIAIPGEKSTIMKQRSNKE